MLSTYSDSNGVTQRSMSRHRSIPPIADTKNGLTGPSRGSRAAHERSRHRGRWVWAVMAMLIASSLGLAFVISPSMQRSHTNYDLHNVIAIDDDAQLQSQAIAEGWPGDGSEYDPFVIEGYEIAAMGYYRGIYVGNTTFHLVIESCYVHDATYSCISLFNVTNATVTQAECVKGQKCIEVSSSSLVNIIGNNCTMAFSTGIELFDCEMTLLVDNNCADNLIGVSIQECGNVSLHHNSAHGNIISGVQLTHTVHSFLANNTCTGGQFGISMSDCGWVTVNDTDLRDSDDTGLALHSCYDCDAERNRCSGHGSCGISIEDSTGCRLRGNDASDNGHGMRGLRCDGCAIWENECDDNDGHGILFEDSGRCTLSDNHCEVNGEDGIGMRGCHDGSVEGNTCSGNGGSGLRCDGGERCDLGHNTCADNGDWGVRCHGLLQCNITGNSLSRSAEGGLLLAESSWVNVSDNGCSETGSGMHLSACGSCQLHNNSVDDCTHGIAVLESIGIELRQNSMTNGGVFVEGVLPEHWNSHEIGPTNSVNGRPIVYLVSVLGVEIPGTPGQVILVECAEVVVDGLDLGNATAGVELAFSDKITVSNSTCSDGYIGIYGFSSSMVIIENSECSRNTRSGVELLACIAGEVRGVDCEDNLEYGVRINASSESEIEACAISGSARGVSAECTPSAGVFISNTISNCTEGVSAVSTGQMQLHLNDIAGCGYGVRLVDSANAIMASNTFTDCGLYIESDVIGYWDSHVIGPDNSVNGRAMVYLVGASVVALAPSTGQAIFVACDWIVAASLNLSSSTAGVLAGFSNHISVLGCNLSENQVGVEYSHTNDGEILSNEVRDCVSEGVRLRGCTGNTVEDNTILRCDIGIGIYEGLSPSTGNEVFGNNASENVFGVVVRGSSETLIEHNTLESSLACGVKVVASDRVVAVNNTCNASGDIAIDIWCSTGCTVQNNTCCLNGRGMYLRSSLDCNISGNILYGSSEYGVCLDYACSGNRVWDNVLAYNNGSTAVYDPLRCQACDDGVGNWWNSSDAPHGRGNYWHDWTTPDLDMDGYVDMPYNVSGAAGAKDLYPVADTSVPIEPIPEFGLLFVLLSVAGLMVCLSRRKRH